jgi:hypothetical protein
MKVKWLPGRQGTGYRKLHLGQGARWDAWIINYPAGHGIPAHVDPLPDRRHLRLNLTILTGGSRLVADATWFRLGERVIVFWSDRRHRVEPGAGRRIVISVGFSLPAAHAKGA